MRMSKMGVKTRRERGNEEALSQEILLQSTQLKRHSSGIYGLGNLLVRARNKVIDIVRKNLEAYDCAEVSLPVIQPRFLWDASHRWDTYANSRLMFTFTGRNDNWYCLAPTGEEIVFDFIKDNILSYKDLPINIFQIGLKYRDEIRIHGGLMRSKEFMMKDGYSFHVSQDDMIREYMSMRECYSKIFEEMNLKVTPVKAVSAEMGGKVSEEFMCFSDIGEDTVLVDDVHGIALNVEVIEHPEMIAELKQTYPSFDETNLRKVHCIELGHIFQLGKFYSESMGGFFTNANGQKEPFYMGCYGIGINRTLGAICEVNCDDAGLVWPISIAPYKCAIIYVDGLAEDAESIYELLKANGVEVIIDDRCSLSFGAKLKDAKLLGFPYAIIIGKKYKETKEIEIERRIDGGKLFIEEKEIVNFFIKNKNLYKNVEEFRINNTTIL